MELDIAIMNVILVMDWALESVRVIPQSIFEYALEHNGEEQFPESMLLALTGTAFEGEAQFLLKEYTGLDWNDPEYVPTPIDLLVGIGMPYLEYGQLSEWLEDAKKWNWTIIEQINQKSLDSLLKK